LFQVICASSQPPNIGDLWRTGYGLPDVLLAVGLQQPGVWGAPMAGQLFNPIATGAPLSMDPVTSALARQANLNALLLQQQMLQSGQGITGMPAAAPAMGVGASTGHNGFH
jgi:hypothetical protein